MSFLSMPILPGEHYISWYVRQAQLQAYPDFKLFLSKNRVASETLRAYEVIHPSILSFLPNFSQKMEAISEHTLLPLWQISVAKELDDSELLESGFLDLHFSNGEKTLFQFDRSWHSCPICREEDVDNHGSSFWHTQHQTPSIFKCYKHGAVLEKAKYPIVDLKLGVLPHQVKQWYKLMDSETEELNKWQGFVCSIQKEMLESPSSLIELKNRITIALGLDKRSNHQCSKQTDQLTIKLEEDLNFELLAYLFTDYARPSKKGTPKLLANLFRGVNNPYKVRSPIHWLLLGYWLFPDDLKI